MSPVPPSSASHGLASSLTPGSPTEPPLTHRMDARLTAWRDANDPRHVFLACYRLMTANVQAAIVAGEFHHPVWVDTLLHRFADYYFEALDAYDRGATDTPAVWQHTFVTTTQHRLHVLQQLFLGVNAHINYDLVLTLLDMLRERWPECDAHTRASFHADHCHINTVIARTIDVVQDDVVERVSPAMNLIDVGLGRVDEWLIARLITRWRGRVWTEACAILDANDPRVQRERLHALERDVLRLARRIALQRG